MRYLALACVGRKHAPELNRRLPPVEIAARNPIQVEAVLVLQPEVDGSFQGLPRRFSGWLLDANGDVEPLLKDQYLLRDTGLKPLRFGLGKGNGGNLLLGYGPRFQPHLGTDGFDFADPHHRLRRVASLFDPNVQVTDPLAFLQRLSYKGVLYERPRSRDFLSRLNRELASLMNVHSGAWMEKKHDFAPAWRCLGKEAKQASTFSLDGARHVLDASVYCEDPFDMTGIMVIDGIEEWCSNSMFAEFLGLLDSLFPKFQFLITLSKTRRFKVPVQFLSQALTIPRAVRPQPKRKPRLPRGAVLLIDVDSTLPNLALMNLSQHCKNQGRKVALARRSASFEKVNEVFASCVFAFPQSAIRVEQLRKKVGSALQVGGSGVYIAAPRSRDRASSGGLFTLS